MKHSQHLLTALHGTLSARLDRARRLLARRLTRRGEALPGLLAAALAREAMAAAPPLLPLAGRAAGVLVGGSAAVTGMFPARVATLAEGVITTMLLTKIKIVVAVVLLAGVVLSGMAGAGYLVYAGEPAAQTDVPGAKAAPAGAEQKDGKKPQPAGKPEAVEEQLKQAQLKLEELLHAQKVQDAQAQVQVKLLQVQLQQTQIKLEKALADRELFKRQFEDLKAEFDKLQKAKPAPGKQQVKVYPVADLVSPKVFALGPGGGGAPPMKDDSEAAALIKVLTKTIEPASWQDMGGAGSIEYFPVGKSLVISQAQDIHLRIQDLLEELRKNLPAEKIKPNFGGN